MNTIRVASSIWFAAAAQFAAAETITPTNAQIENLLSSEVPKISQRWNLRPLFQIVDGSELEMSPEGVVRYGRESLRTTLAVFDDSRREVAMRWIIGHETWHQVQRRDSEVPRPEDLAARRQLECEADIAASQYVIETASILNQSNPDLADAKFLGSTINSIIDMVQRAENGFGGAAAHPAGKQRRSAIRLGLFRGTLKIVEKIPDNEERYGALAQIRSLIDFHEDEQQADWNARMCRMILNSGDGSSALNELDPVIVFNKDGNPPIVDYAIPYKNTSHVPISVMMQVSTVAVPRSSPENEESWKWVDANTFRFDLAPGQQYTVSGRLLWVATAEMYPRLLSPTRVGSLYSATKLESASTGSDDHQSFPLTERQSRLASILQKIFNSGEGKFAAVRKEPCLNETDSRICELNVAVPSAKSAEITYEWGGATSVDIVLYAGESADEATTTFNNFRRDLEMIYGVTIGEQLTLTGTRVASFKPKNSLKLDLRQFKREKRQTVHVTLTPSLF